jgi:hypothetical protein
MYTSEGTDWVSRLGGRSISVGQVVLKQGMAELVDRTYLP